MGDDHDELEREIRAGRAFSIAEAIGRLGGTGVMKGASPVAGRREAAAAIDDCVRRLLPDRAGALAQVLIRRVAASEQLDRDPHRPLAVLAGAVDRLLGSAEELRELVREADAAWGRLMDERPYFDGGPRGGDPADPYTAASVRDALVRLRQALAAG